MSKTARQPSVPGVRRIPRSTSYLPGLDSKIRELALKYGVSPSWVRATLEAKMLKFTQQPDFMLRDVSKKRRKRA